MADINVERKGPSIWPWIIGLIVLALLIWALMELFSSDEPEVATLDPVATETTGTQPAATDPMAAGAGAAAGASAGLSEVLANPATFYGQSFSVQDARVAEVVGDRSFWIESQGQRLLVVKNESPQQGTADVQGSADMRAARNVNVGETVRINGTLHDPSNLDAVQPPLDQQTRQALQGQQVFMQANVADIQHGGM